MTFYIIYYVCSCLLLWEGKRERGLERDIESETERVRGRDIKKGSREKTKWAKSADQKHFRKARISYLFSFHLILLRLFIWPKLLRNFYNVIWNESTLLKIFDSRISKKLFGNILFCFYKFYVLKLCNIII